MEDLNKLGWLIFRIIVFGVWVYIFSIIGDYFDEIIFENNFVLILFFIVQWFGGGFFVYYIQDYLSNLFRNNN